MPMSENEIANNKGAQMSPNLQLQYLEAMGIQFWQHRDQETENNIQPGPAAEAVSVPQTLERSSVETEVLTSPASEVPLENAIAGCTACELYQNRQHVNVAEGEPGVRFMFVTLAPVSDQFLSQAASELFTKMLGAIGLQRSQIYLTSLLKCPPEKNRAPRTTELICCEGFLHQQIEKVKPELVIALGETVAQHLLVSKKPLDELRQAAYQYQNIPVMAMHHPDSLLTNPEDKRKAWHDLQKIQREYNL